MLELINLLYIENSIGRQINFDKTKMLVHIQVTKVARKRIELDPKRCGLNLLLPKSQSFSIWINSFMSCLKYASDHFDTSIGLILTHKHIFIKSLLKSFSFLTLAKYQKNV